MTLDIATYRRAREAGEAARYAAQMARAVTRPTTFEWTHSRSTGEPIGTLTRDGYMLRAVCTRDEYTTGADFDQETEADIFTYAQHRGMSRAVAREYARKRHAEQVREDTEDTTYYVVKVTASREGVTLGRAALGGVGIAYDPITRTDGEWYLDEAAAELIPEAIEDARATLARLCASTGGKDA